MVGGGGARAPPALAWGGSPKVSWECRFFQGKYLTGVPTPPLRALATSDTSDGTRPQQTSLAYISSLSCTRHTEEESEKQGQSPASVRADCHSLEVISSYPFQLLLSSMTPCRPFSLTIMLCLPGERSQRDLRNGRRAHSQEATG